MSSRDLRSGWCSPRNETKSGPLTEEDATAILQHAITCYNDQSEWKRLRTKYKKRTSIVEEIIATEQNYVNQLRLVVEVFMQPLRVDPSYKNILSADDMKTIFSDIEVILSFNRVFLQQLVERHKSWDPFRTKLGDAFLTIADFLKVYTRYINNFNEAHWRLREVLSVSKELQHFIQTQRKLTGNLDLDDFLIMPVQRIPRYNLLLADLVNNTWDHHPDSENLRKAKEKIHEIALFVNEQKRKVDNLKRVGDIILLISGLDEKYNLMSPTRRFVREGEVQEIAPDGERTLYYIYLFNDLIIWTTQKKKLYCFKRMYYISKLNISLSPIEGNKMAICLSTAKDQVLLVPVKNEEMDDWLADLIACRAESLEREEFSKVSKRKTFMHEELISSVQKKPKNLLGKIKDTIVPDESKILHTFKKAMTIADFYDTKKEIAPPIVIPDDQAPSGASISKSGPPPTYADDLKLLFSQPGPTTPGRAKAATISGRGNISSPSTLMSTSAPSLTLRPTMNGVITNPDKLKISQPRLVNSSYTPTTKGATNPPTPPASTPVVSPVNRSQFVNSTSSSPIVPRVNLVNIKPLAPARPLPPPPPNGESPANSPRNRALLSPRVDGSSEGPLTTPRSPRSPPPVVSPRKHSDPGPKTESSLMLSGEQPKKSEAPPPPAQSLKPTRTLSKQDSEVFVQKGPPPPVPLRPTVGPAAISPRGRANSKV